MNMKTINYSLLGSFKQTKNTLFFNGLLLLLFSIFLINPVSAQSLTDSIPTNPEDTVSSGGGGGAVILSGYSCDPLNNVPQWQENTNGDIFNCEDGNVGIGTNNPDIKLHVVGNIATQSTSSSQPDRRITLMSGSSQILQARNDFFIRAQYGGIRFSPGNLSSNPAFSYAHFDARLLVSDNSAIGGSLIGYTPSARLEVIGGNGLKVMRDRNESQQSITFNVFPTATGYNSHFIMDGQGLKIGHNSGYRDIQFQTENITRMSIFQNGHVGIGTEPTQNRLEVAGTIGACKVVVEQNNWCDYVFEDDYKLLPINELEAYINDNKHLPNIPSAKSVDEQGLDLGEMQRMMMEKIEELTLYIITQQKKI